jgi:hypothetical protein
MDVNWSLTLTEEHRLKVFGSRVPRKIFGLKRDEMIRVWRKLHNKKLHDLYSSPKRIINLKRKRRAGHVVHIRKIQFWWQARRKLGTPKLMAENNIKMGLGALRCMDWTDLAQAKDQWRALVSTVMNIRV